MVYTFTLIVAWFPGMGGTHKYANYRYVTQQRTPVFVLMCS